MRGAMWLGLGLGCWLLAVASATPRALQVVAPSGEPVGVYTASYALVIGASKYTHGWPGLPGVAQDVIAVQAALEAQDFAVTTVENPTAQALQEAFSTFITRYGLVPEHRLLIYFAGHGHTVKQAYGEEMGYIVPVDAPNPHQDAHGFFATAMDMQQIEVYAKRIQARHVLFLFDSCFSGSIFSLSRAVPEHINYKTAHPVRQFITSGSAAEQVPDESVFRQQLLAALQGEGDVNGDGYVTGTELGEFLQGSVVNYSKGAQHPQYGKIRNPHLDKGDFVFHVRGQTAPALPRTAAAAGASTPRDLPAVLAFGPTVPDVRGQPLPHAQQALLAQQLAFAQAGTRAVPLAAINTVVDQEPRAGSRVPPGTVVQLVVGTQEALARELMAQATATRNQLLQRDPEERTMYWWSLLARKGRADLLQRSVLLAVEAMQRFPAPESVEAVRRGLGLLSRPVLAVEHDGRVTAVAFNPDGRLLATASTDRTARLWDMPGGQLKARLQHEDTVEALAWSPDGRLLATASADRTARLWDMPGGQLKARLQHEDTVEALAWSPDGRLLATASADRTARLWDMPSGQLKARLVHQERVRQVVFSPDNALLATTSGTLSTPVHSNTALVWDVRSSQVVTRLVHDKGIRHLAFHPQGTAIATASDDGTVRLWEPQAGQELQRFVHKSSVSAVVFSADGQSLATASRDGTARLWHGQSGRELARVRHDDNVDAVAFRPDGTSLATGSQDTTARLWALPDGQEIARLSQQYPVRVVAFSPDGTRVVTASDHERADIWEVWPDDLLATACTRVERNLTPEEWRQVLPDEPYRKTCAALP